MAATTSRNTKPAAPFVIDEDEHEARALEILAGLPASAQARFEKFRQWHLRRSAFRTGLLEAKMAAAQRKTEAQVLLGRHDKEMSRYDYWQREPETGDLQRVSVNDPARDRFVAEVEREKAEIKRLTEEGDFPSATHEQAVLDFLLGLKSQNVKEAPAVRVESKANLLDQHRANRNDKDALLRERRFVEFSNRTRDEMKANANRQIAELIERGRINVGPLRKGGSIIFPRSPIHGAVSERGMQQFVPDGVALFARAFPEKMQELAYADIDALAMDDDGMTVEQKAQRLSEIDAAVLQLDREAEQLFHAAEKDRIDSMAWRRDASPAAILGLA